jgi:hypothetical protein
MLQSTQAETKPQDKQSQSFKTHAIFIFVPAYCKLFRKSYFNIPTNAVSFCYFNLSNFNLRTIHFFAAEAANVFV